MATRHDTREIDCRDGRKAHHARGIEYLDTADINRIELTTGIRTEIASKFMALISMSLTIIERK